MSSRPSAGGPKLRRLNMGQVFIILAVVSAILTIFIFKSLISGKTEDKKVEVKTKPLVVASQQIYSGEIIAPESIKVVQWPEEHYPTGVDVYEEPGKLVGRAAKSNIFPGEPVYRLSLAGEDSQGGLPVVIPEGHRAMTIMVSENKGVGGFIKPGARVDVIGTFKYQIPEASQEAFAEKAGFLLADSFDVTETVLQDVMVLAIAQEMYEKKNTLEEGVKEEPGKEGKPADAKKDAKADPAADDATKAKVVSSITLAVTPEQAERLALADERGRLRLSLRPENEREEVHLLGAVTGDIVSFTKLFEKVDKIKAELSGSFLGDVAGPSSAALPPAEPEPAAALPPSSFSGPVSEGKTVEVIEGSSKTSVSF